MRRHWKWNAIRHIFLLILCIIVVMTFLYKSKPILWDEACEKILPPNTPVIRQADWLPQTGLEFVNYTTAWTQLDLQNLNCTTIDDSLLSESEVTRPFKFHHICPSANFKKGYTTQLAFVNTNEKNAFRLLWRYAMTHPDLVLLDIGANIGALTIPLANAIPTIRVIALEPVTQNLRLLTKAAILNRVQDRVLLLKHAIYDKANITLRTISYGNALSWARIDDPTVYKPPNRNLDKFENRVLTVTFDELIPLVRPYSRCVIKIDIEGAECIAVRKIDNFLSSVHVPIIVMETDKIRFSDEDCVLEAFDILEKRGYKPYSDGWNYFFGSLHSKNFRSWKHINTIWIKQCHG